MSVQCVCGSWDHEPWQHPDRTPTTEAGQTLRDHLNTSCPGADHWREIAAIEDEARAPLVEALEMVRDWQDLDSPEGIAIMLHEVRAALSREDRL